jgi:hypothetical protein
VTGDCHAGIRGSRGLKSPPATRPPPPDRTSRRLIGDAPVGAIRSQSSVALEPLLAPRALSDSHRGRRVSEVDPAGHDALDGSDMLEIRALQGPRSASPSYLYDKKSRSGPASLPTQGLTARRLGGHVGAATASRRTGESDEDRLSAPKRKRVDAADRWQRMRSWRSTTSTPSTGSRQPLGLLQARVGLRDHGFRAATRRGCRGGAMVFWSP